MKKLFKIALIPLFVLMLSYGALWFYGVQTLKKNLVTYLDELEVPCHYDAVSISRSPWYIGVEVEGVNAHFPWWDDAISYSGVISVRALPWFNRGSVVLDGNIVVISEHLEPIEIDGVIELANLHMGKGSASESFWSHFRSHTTLAISNADIAYEGAFVYHLDHFDITERRRSGYRSVESEGFYMGMNPDSLSFDFALNHEINEKPWTSVKVKNFTLRDGFKSNQGGFEFAFADNGRGGVDCDFVVDMTQRFDPVLFDLINLESILHFLELYKADQVIIDQAERFWFENWHRIEPLLPTASSFGQMKLKGGFAVRSIYDKGKSSFKLIFDDCSLVIGDYHVALDGYMLGRGDELSMKLSVGNYRDLLDKLAYEYKEWRSLLVDTGMASPDLPVVTGDMVDLIEGFLGDLSMNKGSDLELQVISNRDESSVCSLNMNQFTRRLGQLQQRMTMHMHLPESAQ